MMVNENRDAYDRKTGQYILAYIDLLGITEKMQKDKALQMIAMNKLHNLYTFSIETTKMIAMDGNLDIQFKIFSDNIIMAKRLSDKEPNKMQDIKCLLYCISYFQELAASDSVGWLMRGGISIGELFIDDTMVWGEALLKSYHLEDKISIYPRILFDKSVVAEIKKHDELHDFIRVDFDDMPFLNYLSICHFVGEPLMRGFQMMQEETGKVQNERVLQKLCWHMNFINKELDAKNEKQDRPYRLCLNTPKV